MILADTSAWIEYLRRTGSPVNTIASESLSIGETQRSPDPGTMEVLAGAPNEERARKRRL